MKQAIKIAAIYTVFSSVYIAVSDRVIYFIFKEASSREISNVQTVKGILFVILSGILIYVLVNFYFKQLKKALKHTNEYRELANIIIESSPDCLGLIDKQGNIRSYNTHLFNTLTLNDRSGNLNINQINHDIVRETISSFVRNKENSLQKIIELKPETWIKISMTKIKTSGTDLLTFIQCENISDQIETELSLHKSIEQYLSIFENIPFGILLIDKHFQINYCNKAFSDLLKINHEPLKTMDWTQKINCEDNTLFTPQFRQAIESESEISMNVRLITINKEDTPNIWRKIYVLPQKGLPNRYLILLIDISRQRHLEEQIKNYSKDLEMQLESRTMEIKTKAKKLEASHKAMSYLISDVNEIREELEVTNKRLFETNKELEAFSYSVSHDLRAPLRSIKGFSNALLDDFIDILNDEGKDFLIRITKNVQRMSDLIDAIMMLSRISRKDLNARIVDISSIAHEIVNELKTSYPSRKIQIHIDDNLSFFGDKSLIRVMLTNLIENAWKFTSETENPKIEVGKNKDGVLYIRDNGIGFEMQNADLIFEPFKQLHSDKHYGGSGIGLAIVKRIIDRHNGTIRVESSPETGTVFYLTLKKNNYSGKSLTNEK